MTVYVPHILHHCYGVLVHGIVIPQCDIRLASLQP